MSKYTPKEHTDHDLAAAVTAHLIAEYAPGQLALCGQVKIALRVTSAIRLGKCLARFPQTFEVVTSSDHAARVRLIRAADPRVRDDQKNRDRAARLVAMGVQAR